MKLRRFRTKVTKADRSWVMSYANGMNAETGDGLGYCLVSAWQELAYRKRRVYPRKPLECDYTERLELETERGMSEW